MADVFDPQKRSEVMSRVRSTGNASTEQRFVKLLRKEKITGWRRKYPLFGKPDLVFPKARLAVFLDGCFWHGCPRHFRMPATRTEYWEAKIERNMRRDRRVARELRARGWRVVRVWEHEIKTSARRKLNRIVALLGG